MTHITANTLRCYLPFSVIHTSIHS